MSANEAADAFEEQARRLIPSVLFESYPELADELNASIAAVLRAQSGGAVRFDLNKVMSELNDEMWTLRAQNAELKVKPLREMTHAEVRSIYNEDD